MQRVQPIVIICSANIFLVFSCKRSTALNKSSSWVCFKRFVARQALTGHVVLHHLHVLKRTKQFEIELCFHKCFKILKQSIVSTKNDAKQAYLWLIKMYTASHWSFVLYEVIFIDTISCFKILF